MRQIFLSILLLLILASNVFATSYVDDANCVAAYLFTEGSGTTVDDASANSNTGNFASSGHPAWWNTDLTGLPSGVTWATDFTPNDIIKVNDNDILTCSSALSIVVWANPDIVTTKGWDWFVLKWGFSSNYEYHFALRAGKISLYLNAATLAEAVYGATTISTGSWQHIAVTWNGTNAYAYLGGSQNGNTGSMGGTITNTTQDVGLGNKTDNNASPFNGKMTEVAIFNRYLSSTEINDIMDNGLKPAVTSRGQVIFISED